MPLEAEVAEEEMVEVAVEAEDEEEVEAITATTERMWATAQISYPLRAHLQCVLSNTVSFKWHS